MSNDQTNQVSQAIEAVEKRPSGMDQCKAIFAEVNAEGYDLGEFKSVRQAFIKRAIHEAAMTEKGASTYWYGLKKHAEGGKLYPYAEAVRKRRQAKAAQEKAAQVFAEVGAEVAAAAEASKAEPEVVQAEPVAAE